MPDRSERMGARDARGEKRWTTVLQRPDGPAGDRESYRITTLHRDLQRGPHDRATLPRRHPVIMNLTEMDDATPSAGRLRRRLIFGCARHGARDQKVFLLSPANVDVTAEDKARIAEGGFFNQS